MRESLRSRLFFSFFALMTVTLLVPALWFRFVMHERALEEAKTYTLHEAEQLRAMLAATNWNAHTLPGLIESLGSGFALRVTLIDHDGRVVADSAASDYPAAAVGTPKAYRQELEETLKSGSGTSVRLSATSGQKSIYAAVRIAPGHMPAPLDQGGVLRVALPYAAALVQMEKIFQHWLFVLGSVFVFAFALSLYLTARIEKPVREMLAAIQRIAVNAKARYRLHNLPGKEFARLAEAFNAMADRIETSIETIEAQKAQLETILHVMEEGVLVLDPQGRIRMLNAMLTGLFPQADSPLGKHPIEVIPSADLQEAINALLAPGQTDAPHPVRTLQIEPRRDLVLSVQLVRLQEPVHEMMAVAVFHDVTDLVRLMRVRRDFVANVSHELRTPLTSIQGYAETLADLPPGDEAMRHRCIEVIQKQAAQMSHLVEDLLTLARLESAALPLEPREVRLAALIRGAAESMETQTTAGGHHIRIDIDEQLSLRVDAHSLSQVFRNLIENACRYAPSGTDIEISAVTSPGELTVSVRDHGPGIAPEALGRIFERFYRADQRRTNPLSTGLGLAICKHIVERHGGRIWAENTPGATIHFTLPLTEPTPPPPAAL